LPEELAARLAGDGQPLEGAPKEEREYRIDGAVGRKRAAAGWSAEEEAGVPLFGGHKKGGSDTMLNILYIERKNKRESGSVNTQWTTLYCVVIIDIYEYNSLLI
jgi:hypothetical protein